MPLKLDTAEAPKPEPVSASKVPIGEVYRDATGDLMFRVDGGAVVLIPSGKHTYAGEFFSNDRLEHECTLAEAVAIYPNASISLGDDE